MMIKQKVNTIFSKIKLLHYLSKSFCNNTANQKYLLHPLNTRGLVQLKGADVTTFLQGIVTNDMRHFAEGKEAIYAMMLNNKGRVMFDTIIHKWDNEDNFILECDRKVLPNFQKHLKMFKLRKDVDIKDVSEEIKLWVLTSEAENSFPQDLSMKDSKLHKDPRLSSLGYRILTPSNFTGQQITKELNIHIDAVDSEDHYRYFLYQLGVSEGVDNLPPNSCFPLEANCDFLHGVSFHKGCYIGQELTARVYHTGVVRKRIMPIKFEDLNPELQTDTIIHSSKKQNIGKLKGLQKNVGLALVRIADALDMELNVGKYKAVVIRPTWWPLEAPKEKIINKDIIENIDVKVD